LKKAALEREEKEVEYAATQEQLQLRKAAEVEEIRLLLKKRFR